MEQGRSPRLRRPLAAALAASLAATGLGVAAAPGTARADGDAQRLNFAGSMQIDYLAVPTHPQARDRVLDGATVELSLRLAADVGKHMAANVKVCVACHGLEVGMAFFNVHLSDQFSLNVGRFTPAFGNFPLRHDPANHLTNDKPLPYDMGRMLRFQAWNEGILPAPWVDNGIEVFGAQFFGSSSLDYAAYAVTGPKGDDTGFDFDYKQSRSPERYYVDNNSQPVVGGRVSLSSEIGAGQAQVGVSGMAGTYDPDASLWFFIAGAEATMQLPGLALRAEYLVRRTEFDPGDAPDSRLKFGPGPGGSYDDYVVRDGFYAEAEVPVGRVSLIGRWDGLRRRGNLLATSPLGADSAVLRYTGAVAVRVAGDAEIKSSVEYYHFTDFEDDLALHIALAAPF